MPNKIKFNLPLFLLLITIPTLALLLAIKQAPTEQASSLQSTEEIKSLMAQINPPEGYDVDISYGNLGPEMLKLGVIDLEKFKKAYESSGQPLSERQLAYLTKGSTDKIEINEDSSYFLLNFFWALGLANKSKVLESGEMMAAGAEEAARLASTGGWNLAKEEPMKYYSKAPLIALSAEEENLVEQVAKNIYRPCCDNPTNFPDCNHGMAMLGFLSLMAKYGFVEQEMYEAGKYLNAYWFPNYYLSIATYFKYNNEQDFSDIDGKIVLGKQYSSSSGYASVLSWLRQKGLAPQSPSNAKCST